MTVESEVVWLRLVVQIYREQALLSVSVGSVH
jgi:hypothetical protein